MAGEHLLHTFLMILPRLVGGATLWVGLMAAVMSRRRSSLAQALAVALVAGAATDLIAFVMLPAAGLPLLNLLDLAKLAALAAGCGLAVFALVWPLALALPRKSRKSGTDRGRFRI